MFHRAFPPNFVEFLPLGLVLAAQYLVDHRAMKCESGAGETTVGFGAQGKDGGKAVLAVSRGHGGTRVLLAEDNELNREVAVGEAQARAVLDDFGPPQRPDGGWDGHVFNLGHGISQHTPPEHVTALVEAVHAHSRLLRSSRPA